jgi:hypothetical protein
VARLALEPPKGSAGMRGGARSRVAAAWPRRTQGGRAAEQGHAQADTSARTAPASPTRVLEKGRQLPCGRALLLHAGRSTAARARVRHAAMSGRSRGGVWPVRPRAGHTCTAALVRCTSGWPSCASSRLKGSVVKLRAARPRRRVQARLRDRSWRRPAVEGARARHRRLAAPPGGRERASGAGSRWKWPPWERGSWRCCGRRPARRGAAAPRKALFVQPGLQRVEARDEHVQPQVELESLHQQRVREVPFGKAQRTPAAERAEPFCDFEKVPMKASMSAGAGTCRPGGMEAPMEGPCCGRAVTGCKESPPRLLPAQPAHGPQPRPHADEGGACKRSVAVRPVGRALYRGALPSRAAAAGRPQRTASRTSAPPWALSRAAAAA